MRAVAIARSSTAARVALDGTRSNGVVTPSRAARTACVLDSSTRTRHAGSAARSVPENPVTPISPPLARTSDVAPGWSSSVRPVTNQVAVAPCRPSTAATSGQTSPVPRPVPTSARPTVPGAPGAERTDVSPTSRRGPSPSGCSRTGGPTRRPAAAEPSSPWSANEARIPASRAARSTHRVTGRARSVRRAARGVTACRAARPGGHPSSARGPSRTGSPPSNGCSGPAWWSWWCWRSSSRWAPLSTSHP